MNMRVKAMACKSCETILAIILLPTLVTPELNLLGVSFQLAIKLCNKLEPQTKYGMKIENWQSGLSSSRACAWTLNHDSWISGQGRKGIWKVTCSKKASSEDKSRKGGTGCYDPCANVPPQKQSPLNDKENSFLGKKECPKSGAPIASLYYGNYHQCSNSQEGTPPKWKEHTCGNTLYWNPDKANCTNYLELSMQTQEKHCGQGCGPRCPNTSPTQDNPYPGGPPLCGDETENCNVGDRRNHSTYCRNYFECKSIDGGRSVWKECVCPEEEQFYYQSTQCQGDCVEWEELPWDLKKYFQDSVCCNTYNNSLITPTPTPSTTTTTRPPGACCNLRGYCNWYQLCVDGIWGSSVFLCRRGLYWLPNSLTGGTCVRFDSLTPDLQEAYKKDPQCWGCDWYQRDGDQCSPRYTFKYPNGTEVDLTCTSAPGQSPLYWQLELRTCDYCINAVDNQGKPCSC